MLQQLLSRRWQFSGWDGHLSNFMSKCETTTVQVKYKRNAWGWRAPVTGKFDLPKSSGKASGRKWPLIWELNRQNVGERAFLVARKAGIKVLGWEGMMTLKELIKGQWRWSQVERKLAQDAFGSWPNPRTLDYAKDLGFYPKINGKLLAGIK